MNWRNVVQHQLVRRTGYEVRKAVPAPAPAPPEEREEARPPRYPEVDRLLREPVFLLSSVRSGSTLLRMMLDSHPRVHAPHEMHLRRMGVELKSPPVRMATEASGLSRTDLEHLLWDRVLHREMVRHGKDVLVEKTPSNVFGWWRIQQCWPDARWIFLIRHPVSIARSWHEADPEERTWEKTVPHTLRFMEAVERCRTRLPGPTVRYEDLVADPEKVTRGLCDELGLEWSPMMLEYGARDHGPIIKGIGDWRDKITTGRVQPGRELPDPSEIPEALVPIARAWGYLD
ncbi:sulfotransferase family protein [Actinocorallia herbida]|uniref:Sulfotransferase family protein n=1 Tax=Actinocorallia herbida TaxID=58109 RepID=A0A3N1DA25_9ACTN|nr:sulfotransferase [Actinocorallia herbida]ROO89958.1 sulfotransferase family protein [Actinocorallia herbida]